MILCIKNTIILCNITSVCFKDVKSSFYLHDWLRLLAIGVCECKNVYRSQELVLAGVSRQAPRICVSWHEQTAEKEQTMKTPHLQILHLLSV